MKRLLCVLLTLLLVLPIFTVASFAEEAKTVSFTDVDGTTERGKAILKLAQAGVLLGYPDGTFKPDQNITRGELSKVINKIFNYTEADTEVFSDVDKTRDWYYNEVAIAKKAGYIKGYEDGTFRGENNMTREEACTILTRVGGLYDLGLPMNITDAVSEWAAPYVKTVIISGFMALEEGETFRATENITRGEFCEAFAKFVKAEAIVPPADDKKEEDKKEDNKKEEKPSGTVTIIPGGSSGNDEEEEEEEVPVVDYAELNADVVQNLSSALEELEEFYCAKEYEEKLVAISTECINIVLGYTETAEITDDFVNDVCADQISEARKVWGGMSVDDKNSFIATAVPEFKVATVEWLQKFFGISL